MQELKVEIAGLKVGCVEYLEKQQEFEKVQFEFDTYVKYLQVRLGCY